MAGKIREVEWADQAGDVMSAAPFDSDHLDGESPDLTQVKSRACITAWALARVSRAANGEHIDDLTGTVRLWFDADDRRVVIIAVQASYDGGKTFENPLSRYGKSR